MLGSHAVQVGSNNSITTMPASVLKLCLGVLLLYGLYGCCCWFFSAVMLLGILLGTRLVGGGGMSHNPYIHIIYNMAMYLIVSSQFQDIEKSCKRITRTSALSHTHLYSHFCCSHIINPEKLFVLTTFRLLFCVLFSRAPTPKVFSNSLSFIYWYWFRLNIFVCV